MLLSLWPLMCKLSFEWFTAGYHLQSEQNANQQIVRAAGKKISSRGYPVEE